MDVAKRCAEALAQVPPGVTVVAAAKGRTPDEVREAIRAGITHIGENYVQDAARKRTCVPEPATWHLIGRLQTNKARPATHTFDWIQTVDSVEIARKIETALAPSGKAMPVLVQVNIGREPQKAGVLPEAVPDLVRTVQSLPRLTLRGLMALPPEPTVPEDSRPYFRAMRKLFDALRRDGFRVDTLSMGMSADWEVAVEEGATMIRLGTLLFGPRRASG